MPKNKITKTDPIRLGLGTAQFGLDYGVTNRGGKPPDATVAEILADAMGYRLGIIDTAPTYGDAELRLGSFLPKNHQCLIVTKTASKRETDYFAKDDAVYVRDMFYTSLRNLRCDTVYGLLVHLGKDVLLPGGERLIETLVSLRKKGYVRKIGVSVYDADELDEILKIFKPEIVQLPLSVADQRLLQSGHLKKLKELGIEIHIRSIFLQGVLLANPASLPAFMVKYATKIQKIKTAYPGATSLEVCLAFTRQIPELDCVVVGASTLEEWRNIRQTFELQQKLQLDFSSLAMEENQILNPNFWPKEAN